MKNKNTIDYKKRKKKAQFFTPKELVKRIIDESGIDFNNRRILEPSCGEGAFIEELINNNNYIYAVDKDRNKIKKIKERFNEVNAITTDFLKYNPNIKFDIVIGNPPFNLPTDLNYVDSTEGFIEHAIDLTKEDGYIIFIIPNTVLRNKKYQSLRKNIIENTEILKIMDTRGNDFLGADIETVALFLKKKKVDMQTYTYLTNEKTKKIYLNRNSRDTIKINNDDTFNKISKMIGKEKLGKTFEIYRGRSNDKNALKGKDIDFYNDTIATEGEQYYIGLQNIAYRLVANVIKANDNEISDTITILKPKYEMKYEQLCYIANYLNTPIANYMIHVNAFNNSKLTMHIDKYYIDDTIIPSISNTDNKTINTLLEPLNLVRNNKEFAYIRNQYFYKRYNIEDSLQNEIEEMWQFPKYKVKSMEKKYGI